LIGNFAVIFDFCASGNNSFMMRKWAAEVAKKTGKPTGKRLKATPETAGAG
jgi:hypothetical protein